MTILIYNMIKMIIMINFKKLFIVLALSWGFLGCDSLINKHDKNIQQEDDYVQLAKKFEQKYLPKMRAARASSKPKLSKKEYKKIVQRHNFDAEKIEDYKREILQIAESYGLDKTKFDPFDKYFFINPYTGKILDKDYYRMAFAYLKYLEVQLAPQFKKADKINKRISALTKKYNALVEKAETSLEQRKLMEEYQKKLEKIRKAHES